jgi:uracil-DNA glycosylase
MRNTLQQLVRRIEACRICEGHLPYPPRPVLRVSATARLLIVGQAPGVRVHQTGMPWNDPSGDRLRGWLDLSREMFYDRERVAIVPTGLCYPGKGVRGDLPPRPECAPLWHPALRELMPEIRLTLLIGLHAQAYYLGARRKPTMAATVRAFTGYLPEYLPLPHPSPRNLLWFRRHPWLEQEVLPEARRQVHALLNTSTRDAAGDRVG